MQVDHLQARDAFLEGLDTFVAVVRGLSDADLMAASRCTGWTVVDVVVHVHLGLQEMLLGLVTPTERAPDADAASYWKSPPPTNDDEADRLDGTRFVRRLGAAYRRPAGAVRHLLPAAAGVRSATLALRPGAVAFQGHVLTTGDFLATWAVEVAVHHLDLGRDLLLPAPATAALRLARDTVAALAGTALPALPDDEIVLHGTGRVRCSPPVAAAFPVLG